MTPDECQEAHHHNNADRGEIMLAVFTHLLVLGIGIWLGLEGRRDRVVYRERVVHDGQLRQQLYILRTASGETRPVVVEVDGRPWDGWEDTVMAHFSRQNVLPSEVGAFDEVRRFAAERRAAR